MFVKAALEQEFVEYGRECFHFSCHVIRKQNIPLSGLRLLLGISEKP